MVCSGLYKFFVCSISGMLLTNISQSSPLNIFLISYYNAFIKSFEDSFVAVNHGLGEVFVQNGLTKLFQELLF